MISCRKSKLICKMRFRKFGGIMRIIRVEWEFVGDRRNYKDYFYFRVKEIIRFKDSKLFDFI